MSFPRLIALFGCIFFLGCPGLGGLEPEVEEGLPEMPTWSEHVKPILDRTCNECHSDPPQQAAPGSIRLDVCENLGKPGAQSQAARIQIRMIDQLPTPMPPATYANQPTPEDIEVVRRWIDQGAPCDGTSANNGANNGATNNGATNNGATNNGATNNGATNNGATNNGNTPMPVTTFAELTAVLKGSTCGNAGCHPTGGRAPNLGPAMTDAEFEEALRGAAVNGMAYIQPGNKEASELYRRLSSTDALVRMPRGGQNLPEVENIGTWIDAGAMGFTP